MSTSPGELEQFLADLSVRRQRLLGLAGSDALEKSTMVEELLELSEQLVVADEELRVQQEELEATRQRMEALSADWTALFESSSAALVLTDANGVVLRMTRAAAQLTLQPQARQSPRPIATWFEVADRARVRTLISQRNLGQPIELERVRLWRSDGTTSIVDVRVTPTEGSSYGQLVLSWELTPSAAPELRLVTTERADSALSSPALSTPALSTAILTELVSRLAVPRSLDETLAAVAEEVAQLVPGVEQATVVRHTRGGEDEVVGQSGPLSGGGGTASVPLVMTGTDAVELQLHPAVSASAGEMERTAELLAVHVQLAVALALKERDLRRAVQSHEQIGQAVGRLVERRGISTDDAFSQLVQRSQHANRKLRDVARAVVETGRDPERISFS